jgi:hypothetical protein
MLTILQITLVTSFANINGEFPALLYSASTALRPIPDYVYQKGERFGTDSANTLLRGRPEPFCVHSHPASSTLSPRQHSCQHLLPASLCLPIFLIFPVSLPFYDPTKDHHSANMPQSVVITKFKSNCNGIGNTTPLPRPQVERISELPGINTNSPPWRI